MIWLRAGLWMLHMYVDHHHWYCWPNMNYCERKNGNISFVQVFIMILIHSKLTNKTNLKLEVKIQLPIWTDKLKRRGVFFSFAYVRRKVRIRSLSEKMPRTRCGWKIMPQRVLGILDDPQRVLAIFLQKKNTERVVGHFDSFNECHNTLWAFFLFQKAHNALWQPFWICEMPTTHCGHTNIPATHEQYVNNTSTTH